MKIKRIYFNNFRQFYKEQEILFCIDGNTNVTVIHGENGSGKTAILNGFKWVFYEETDFETGNEFLLSEMARAEASKGNKLEMYVAIDFEHEGLEYIAKRKQSCTMKDDLEYSVTGGSILSLTYKIKGERKESPNPDAHIGQIIPHRMYSFFFFNGERIEELAKIDAYNEIKDAIKSMMGLEIMERAIRHLSKYVIKDLRQKLKKNTSSADLKSLMDDQTEVENLLEDIKRNISDANNNLKHAKSEKADINNRLKEIREVTDLQTEHDEKEKLRDKYKGDLEALRKDRTEWVSKFGFLAFTNDLLHKIKTDLENKRKKGELPTQIRAQFIDDLIEDEVCICDRELLPDTPPYSKVVQYKDTTTTDDVDDAFIKIFGSVNSMLIKRGELFNELKKFSNNINQNLNDIDVLDKKLDQIKFEIGDLKIENASKLEEKRDKADDKIDRFNQQIGSFNKEREGKKTELDNIERDIKKAKKKESEKNEHNERLGRAEETKKVIVSLYESLSDQVRLDLSKKVSETFQSIMKKSYEAEISDEYTLQVYKQTGDHRHLVHDKSTGESQISSLSFIASLIFLAKERYESKQLYYKGGIFPIVMDSPYGSLDPEYQEKSANIIPALADQVILLVSNSQWKGIVSSAIKSRTGKEYTLIYHTPDKKADTLTSSVVGGSDIEHTEIKEGYYE